MLYFCIKQYEQVLGNNTGQYYLTILWFLMLQSVKFLTCQGNEDIIKNFNLFMLLSQKTKFGNRIYIMMQKNINNILVY